MSDEKTPVAQDATTAAEEVAVSAQVSDFTNIVRKLIADGAKKIGGLKVRNLNATDQADNGKDYTMVSLTLCNKVPGYVRDEDTGAFEEGMTNVIFTSLYGVVGSIREDEDLNWIGNNLISNPKLLEPLIIGGSLDIIQQRVKAGEPYVNPFTTRQNAAETVFDHDMIINHIVKIRPGKAGLKVLDRMLDKIIGF